MDFYPGDHVKYNNRDCIVIGSYALFHASDMDGIQENDHRFRDYRVIDKNNGFIPLTWVRDSELTLLPLSDFESKERSAVIIRVKEIYKIIKANDKG